MKTIITLILFNFSLVHSQFKANKALETRSENAVYFSKSALNNPESVPKINGIQQDEWFTSVQVNTSANSNNIIDDAANEPSIAVNPLNPQRMAIGWRQFNSRFNSFRQAGRSYSEDGGLTWNYQEVFEPGVFRSDPVLASDADGVFYYNSLKVVASRYNRVTQMKSLDGGKTWVDNIITHAGDKNWIAIDKTDSLGRGNIYQAWNIYGGSFGNKTFNNMTNGSKFNLPIEIPNRPIFGTLDVNSQGELFVVGIDVTNSTINQAPIYLTKSAYPLIENPIFTQSTLVDIGGPMVKSLLPNPSGLGGQIYVKIDRSNRVSRDNVYILASIAPASLDPLNIHFTRSIDGGLTFSDYKQINTDDSFGYQWFGTMSVAPNGRIDVIWYDTRNDDGTTDTNETSRMFYTYSYDAGMTFVKEQAVTPRFNQSLGYPEQRKIGDYIDMVSDNKGAHITYSATFNGEQDIYYMYARPSAIEENPDFPTILTNNVWAVEGVPSQGILSSTLINNGNLDNPLLSFEGIFTAKPDGTPMWLIATGELPLEGDSYSMPLYLPTGDLSEGGQALRAIGMVTKKRLRDENNELVDNKIEYSFDMTNEVKQQLQELLGAQYNEDFYNNNPFYNTSKKLVFNSLLPREQRREDLCNINGQVIMSEGEKSEGRLQYTYFRDGVLHLFAADFTYDKSLDENGDAVVDLDENGLANPTWEVLQSNEAGIQMDNSVVNRVFTPNGGLGFFEQGEATGITEIGIEQISVNGNQITTLKPDKSIEIMNILANNAYCGEIH